MPEGTRESGRRSVPVPLPIFKVVTVVTTLLAVLVIIAGFWLIDLGTDRARAAPEDVDVAVTLVGLVLIGLAAALYAFSTRFTPEERANDKGASTEPSDDG